MRTLLVLRHAKSSWDEQGLDDHERPLNKRGERDAPRVGDQLREQGLMPDLVMTSDAVRALTTAEAVTRAAGYAGEIVVEPSLYLASPDDVRVLLQTIERAHVNTIMIVGHNPGLSDFVTRLTGEPVELPTAALAQIVLSIDSWADLSPTTRGTLVALWRPKEF